MDGVNQNTRISFFESVTSQFHHLDHTHIHNGHLEGGNVWDDVSDSFYKIVTFNLCSPWPGNPGSMRQKKEM